MKFPKFMKPKTLFSGLSVAGAIGLFAIANGSQVSADTITWQQSTDAWSEGMMHFERNGRESRSKYVVLRLNDRVVFCLDPWTPVVEGADYDYNESKYTKDVTNLGEANVPIDEATFRRLELIAYYGYYGSADKRDWRAVMTQALIWNEMGYTPKQFTGDLTMTDFENFKAEVMEKVNNHQAFTSWNGSTKQIQKGQTIELTDENNVIQKLSIPSTQDGYTFSLNGNVLSITATEDAPKESKTFTFTSADTSYEGASLVWFKSGSQTVGEFKIKDGNIGSVSLLFHIRGSNTPGWNSSLRSGSQNTLETIPWCIGYCPVTNVQWLGKVSVGKLGTIKGVDVIFIPPSYFNSYKSCKNGVFLLDMSEGWKPSSEITIVKGKNSCVPLKYFT